MLIGEILTNMWYSTLSVYTQSISWCSSKNTKLSLYCSPAAFHFLQNLNIFLSIKSISFPDSCLSRGALPNYTCFHGEGVKSDQCNLFYTWLYQYIWAGHCCIWILHPDMTRYLSTFWLHWKGQTGRTCQTFQPVASRWKMNSTVIRLFWAWSFYNWHLIHTKWKLTKFHWCDDLDLWPP